MFIAKIVAATLHCVRKIKFKESEREIQFFSSNQTKPMDIIEVMNHKLCWRNWFLAPLCSEFDVQITDVTDEQSLQQRVDMCSFYS